MNHNYLRGYMAGDCFWLCGVHVDVCGYVFKVASRLINLCAHDKTNMSKSYMSDMWLPFVSFIALGSRLWLRLM